jgi:hypothetical protein
MFPRKLTMGATSGPSDSSGAAPPPRPAASSPDGAASVPMAKQARRRGVRRLPSDRKSAWAVAAALVGLSGGCASSATAPAASPSATAGHAGFGGRAGGGGGSNARSGPAAGGSVGTVGSLSTSGFTLSTATGQKVTIKEASTTRYQKGTSSASASVVTTGESILVLGTTNGTSITATQVIVQAGGGKSATSSAQAIPFQRGAPTSAKKVGQIPANYTEGSGTIVSGTTANKATEAALAAYPGGVVDRVVKLSGGGYEAHNIGVNWPHHVFISQDFKVAGAD